MLIFYQMLTDCHAHLHVKEFDVDRAQAIERARKAGVTRLVNVGFDTEGNFQALALAKKYKFIYATMGIHPHLASEWNDQVGAKIFEAAKREEKIIALGEMGLDYFKNFQPVRVQKIALQGQLKLAQELDLPVIIHCRDAFSDLFKMLKPMKLQRVLLHCFTGSLTDAEESWKRGYYTAFTGIITYPSATALRAVAEKCPMSQLLIETDCPFLAPQSHRGQRNEPAFLKETFQKIAQIRKIPETKLEKTLGHNSEFFFNLGIC